MVKMLKKKENIRRKIARAKVTSSKTTENAQAMLQSKLDDGRSLSIYLSVQAQPSESDKRILPIFIDNVDPNIQHQQENQQCLIFGGKELEYGRTVSVHSIQKGSTGYLWKLEEKFPQVASARKCTAVQQHDLPQTLKILGESSTTTISLSREKRKMQMLVNTRSGKTLRLEVEISEGINNMQADIRDEDGRSFFLSLFKEKKTEIERNRETTMKIFVKTKGKTIRSEVECSYAIDDVKATIQDTEGKELKHGTGGGHSMQKESALQPSPTKRTVEKGLRWILLWFVRLPHKYRAVQDELPQTHN